MQSKIYTKTTWNPKYEYLASVLPKPKMYIILICPTLCCSCLLNLNITNKFRKQSTKKIPLAFHFFNCGATIHESKWHFTFSIVEPQYMNQFAIDRFFFLWDSNSPNKLQKEDSYTTTSKMLSMHLFGKIVYSTLS